MKRHRYNPPASPLDAERITEKCCFVCGRKFNPNNSRTAAVMAYTTDGQRVYVGRDCYDHVLYWDDRGGYQPPQGGPCVRSYPPEGAK